MPSSESLELRRLALKLAVAGLVAGAALGGLELAARRAPTSFRQKRMALTMVAPSVRVLVLGPSVAFNGIDPGAWQVPAYNLANNAQTLYYDRSLLETWASHLVHLDTVVLGFSYASLRCTVDSLNEQARAFAYRQVFGIPDEVPADRGDLRNVSAALTLQPFKVLRWALTGRGLVLGDVGSDGQESLPVLSSDQQDLQLSPLAGQEMAARHARLMTQPPSYGLAQLKGLLDLCASHDWRAAVVVPPVSQAYAQAVDAAVWAADRKAVRELCQREHAAYRDYFQDNRFGNADFSDVDHLAGPGARRFSIILLRDLGLPGPARSSLAR